MAGAPPVGASFPIYWERQEAALCATHAINNLLQGPYYTEIGMSEIACAIDDRERQLMAENGVDSAEYLSFCAQDSSNVDASGNFSVEVIAQALQHFALECTNITKPDCLDARQRPTGQTGFICNLQSHWLSLRKIGGQWFNLNSLQATNDGWGPVSISEFYLDSYLHELQQQRYTIFVVRGAYPPVDATVDVQQRGRWFDSNEVVDYTRNPQKLKRQKLAHGGSAGGGAAQMMRGADADLARAIAASMQTTESGGSAVWKGASQAPAAAAQADEDEDLRRALEMSNESWQHDVAAINAATAASAAAASSPRADQVAIPPSPAPAASTSLDSSVTPGAAVSPAMPEAAPAVATAAATASSGTNSTSAQQLAPPPPTAASEVEDEEAALAQAIALSLQQ